jgi:hypothetical protein
VVLLDAGRIVAEGTHDELLETSERYREVLAQAELDEDSSVDPEAPALADAEPGAGGRG